MIDWEIGPSAPLVPYPELFDEVLAGLAYWSTEPMNYVGPKSEGGVRYVRNYEMPPEAGRDAWRRHDPAHPRCWYCGRFVSPKWSAMYTTGCRDCGEWLGGRSAGSTSSPRGLGNEMSSNLFEGRWKYGTILKESRGADTGLRVMMIGYANGKTWMTTVADPSFALTGVWDQGYYDLGKVWAWHEWIDNWVPVDDED